MPRTFATNGSHSLPDDQIHALSNPQIDTQTNKRHVHTIILGTGFSGLGQATKSYTLIPLPISTRNEKAVALQSETR
jgi:hypothetical protein